MSKRPSEAVPVEIGGALVTTGAAPGDAPGADDPLARRRSLSATLAAPATRSVRMSGRIAVTLFAVLLVASAVIPIASGAIASGQIAIDGERKVVQHITGGVVAEIAVKNGDVVEAGAVVMRLDDVQAGASAGVATSQVDALRTEEVVRLAEAAGAETMTIPDDLLARAGEPAVAALIAAQRGAFASRLAQTQSRKSQFDQQRAQIRDQIAASRAELGSERAQGLLLKEEVEGLRGLLEKGLVQRTRVLALDRAVVASNGRVESLEAQIRRLQSQSAELATLRDRVGIDRQAEAAIALRTVQGELAGAVNRQQAARDTLGRMEVKAPVKGTVMGLRVTTIGGVVEPGQPLMEIVPNTGQLVVKAHVRPQDADALRAGMPAVVRLDASGVRTATRINGVVKSISADALNDPRTGAPYFELSVAIPTAEARKAPPELLAPGLPAEVLVKTGSRTILAYLFDPILRVMSHAMRDA